MIRSEQITIGEVGLSMEEVDSLQVGMVMIGMLIIDREVGLGLVTEIGNGVPLIWISCLNTSLHVGFFSILRLQGNFDDL